MDANQEALYNLLVEGNNASVEIQKDNQRIYDFQQLQRPQFPIWKTAKGVLWLIVTFSLLGSIGDSFVWLLFAVLFGYFAVKDGMVVYNWYKRNKQYDELKNGVGAFQDEINYLISVHSRALSLLPSPYYLNPQAYNRGAQFVASGMADSIGQVISLLDTFGLGN